MHWTADNKLIINEESFYEISRFGRLLKATFNTEINEEIICIEDTLELVKLECEKHFKNKLIALNKEYKTGTKICVRCIQEKKYSEYAKQPTAFDSKKSTCKKCCIEIEVERGRTLEGLIRSLYNGKLCSSKKKPYKTPDYSLDEFRDWVKTKPEFVTLYYSWKRSEYDTYLRPSIDRINTKVGYKFNNIQIVTWRENMDLNYEERRIKK